MGLAFLPWERLPAYVFGPLLVLIGIFAVASDEKMTAWHVILAIFNICLGAWIVWYRYTKGIEPLWTEEQRQKADEREKERKVEG
jgi:hypothetical protein